MRLERDAVLANQGSIAISLKASVVFVVGRRRGNKPMVSLFPGLRGGELNDTRTDSLYVQHKLYLTF